MKLPIPLSLALLLASSAVAAEPIDFEAAFVEAEAKNERGAREEASADFESLADALLARWPEHPAIARALFRSSELTADGPKKERLYQRILSIRGAPIEAGLVARAILAEARTSGGFKAELVRAHALFRAQAKGSAAAEALFRAAQILASDLEDLKEARKPLDRLISTMPDESRALDARVLRAEVLMRSGQKSDALLDYEFVASSTHASTAISDDARILEAECLLSLGRPEAALARYLAFIDARAESPLWDRALFDAAKIQDALGRKAEAAELKARLRALRPGSPYL